MTNKLVLISALILNLTGNAFGVAGLEKTWKAYHPGSEGSCFTCHSTKKNELPSNQNVSELGRRYYSEIMEMRKNGAPHFRPYSPLQKVDFAVFGDSRTNLEVNEKIVNEIVKDNPEAVFHTGDMVADGNNSSQWNALLPIMEKLLNPKILFPSCGNHEGSGCVKNVIREALGNDKYYYTQELGNFQFVALDSNRINSKQLQWINDLEPGKNYIPYFHHPAYPVMAGHGPDSTVKKEFIPRFKRLGVKLVFTGHNHGYDRTIEDGIMYVTVGGGGAPLYPCPKTIRPDQVCISDYGYLRCAMDVRRITCQAKLLDGMLIDSFTVEYPTQRHPN
jgi:predicted phosphodiesterase